MRWQRLWPEEEQL
jgi:enabled protein